jgi:nucleoside 2-deoxyribosyltransferase
MVEQHRGSGDGALTRRLAALRAKLERVSGGHEKEANRAGRGVVYCSGPLFCPEELGAMAEIARVLEETGCETFLPQRDGVEAFVMNQVDAPLANAWILRPIQNLVNRAVFALDIFQIAERCDSFVFNMNGRVPDEGGIVETAVAFAMGRPLLIYNGDRRSLAGGRPHPMIITAARTVVNDTSRIPSALESMAAVHAAAGPARSGLPPQVRRTVNFGRRVWKLLGMIGFLRPRNALLSAASIKNG